MRLKLTTNARIWMLLAAWVLFTGLCVADTFDLSDDIVLPTALVQQAVTPASEDERKPHVFSVNIFTYGGESHHVSLVRDSDVGSVFSVPFIYRDMPLYQRHSVYRI